MGVDTTVIMFNLRLLEEAVRKRLDNKVEEKVEKDDEYEVADDDEVDDDEDDEWNLRSENDWKQFLYHQQPQIYIDTFRYRATHMYSELAEKLKLENCWSDETQFEELLASELLFEQDLAEEYEAKNGTKSEEQVAIENMRYPNLLTICQFYNDKTDYGMGFVHPSRVAKLSERLGHCSQIRGIPSNILQEAFMKDYKDNYLNNPKKRKTENSVEQNKTLEEWVFYEYDHISFFCDIVLRYNNPASFCSLLPKTPIDYSQPTVKLFENLDVKFSDLADEYWVNIMEFIEDPFTLIRFAKGNTVLYRLFTERKDALFRNFQHLKADIGLFCYLS
ncbi:hypothetical protein C9374_013243 [Naegleria lovaniensis]|uniref:Uncharacterized protein n=1 Tax=Naegleria lovaniensis TaxID=51637 RepID=A0AA88GVF4_NAELO|nr:uncharacterized protein C9374_013243 [Naegleria lovaniensis]KAG2391758.1 hypothetical protein C9374_013243 [Naegleria lovaniensis]